MKSSHLWIEIWIKKVPSESAYFSFHANLQRNIARKTIAPLVLELRDKDQLPAICFNDDRRICEEMAICLFQFLEEKQKEYEESEEYRTKYAIKDEEVIVLVSFSIN